MIKHDQSFLSPSLFSPQRRVLVPRTRSFSPSLSSPTRQRVLVSRTRCTVNFPLLFDFLDCSGAQNTFFLSFSLIFHTTTCSGDQNTLYCQLPFTARLARLFWCPEHVPFLQYKCLTAMEAISIRLRRSTTPLVMRSSAPKETSSTLLTAHAESKCLSTMVDIPFISKMLDSIPFCLPDGGVNRTTTSRLSLYDRRLTGLS